MMSWAVVDISLSERIFELLIPSYSERMSVSELKVSWFFEEEEV